MDAPLTPQEQAELAALEAQHGAIGQANPNARRVEVPSSFQGIFNAHQKSTDDKIAGKKGAFEDDPADKAYAGQVANAVAGSVLAQPGVVNNFGAPAKAAGRGVRSIVDFVGGKAAGMSPAEVAAYQKSPQLVEQIAKESDLARQARAEQAMNSTADSLKNKVFGPEGIESRLQATFKDKSIPESDLTPAGDYAPPKYQGYTEGGRQVPLTDVYKAAREAGNKKTSWVQDPISGNLTKATNPEAADAWSFLRAKTVGAAPEAEAEIQAMHDAVDTQKAIRSGFNRPTAFVQSKAPDTAAARQAADQMAGSSHLEDLSGQLNAAKSFNAPAHGLTDKILQPVGRAALKTTSRAASIGGKVVDATAPTAGRLAVRQSMPPLTQEDETPLSPEEQHELQTLEARAAGR